MAKRLLVSLAVLPLLTGCLVVLGASPAAAAATCQVDVGRIRTLPDGSTVSFTLPGYWADRLSSTHCNLRQGDATRAVKRLQATLDTCYNQGIAIDGQFGPATRRALENAQTWERVVRGRPVATDGVYGPQTRDAMHWSAFWAGNFVCMRTDTTISDR
jgi:hypothetical protein